jgi:hypothetical protein
MKTNTALQVVFDQASRETYFFHWGRGKPVSYFSNGNDYSMNMTVIHHQHQNPFHILEVNIPCH